MADDNYRSYRSRDPRDNSNPLAREGAADPLAELARLIGQSDPYAEGAGREATYGPGRPVKSLVWIGRPVTAMPRTAITRKKNVMRRHRRRRPRHFIHPIRRKRPATRTSHRPAAAIFPGRRQSSTASAKLPTRATATNRTAMRPRRRSLTVARHTLRRIITTIHRAPAHEVACSSSWSCLVSRWSG